ncbi:insulinase family protein [Sphingobacteriales bacterium CHB3]|nr:insulinase family protein [Sphingobacteriales bacterium CHB3]
MKSLTLGIIVGILLSTIAVAKTPIKVTEIRSQNSPLITFRIILRAGSINDWKGKEGINALTAFMIAQGGTKDLKYQEVVATMYPWAANVNVQPENEITTFVGHVHRDHLDAFYKLFSDLLLNPRFDLDDFTRNKDLMLSYLEKNLRGTDDENLGKEAFLISMFKDHPYGTAGATVQGLKSTTLDDVKAYYKQMYTTGRIWIGIAGGYPATLVTKMKNDFAKLPEGKFEPVPLPEPPKIEGLEIDFVQKPARGTAISLGHPLPITRKDKDFYALMVANSYLGEHRTFNGVLMNRLRGDRGLNYGDYSYIERFTGGTSGTTFPNVNTPLRQQYFSVWLRPVQPENAHFAVRAAVYELEKFVEKGLSQEDFEATRKFVTNYSKLWAQTLDRRLGYKMDSEFYGTEYFIDRIEKELKTLRVSDVNTVIKKHIDPKNMKVAMVANDAQDLMEKMVKNEASPITYASPVSERILEEDKTITVLPLGINKSKSRVVPVEELFENESPGKVLERKGTEKYK